MRTKIKVLAPVVLVLGVLGGLFGLGPAASGAATAKADVCVNAPFVNVNVNNGCGGWNGGWNSGWNGGWNGGGWGGGCRNVALLSDYWQPGYSEYWGSRGHVWVQGPPFGITEWNGTIYRTC